MSKTWSFMAGDVNRLVWSVVVVGGGEEIDVGVVRVRGG